MALAWHDNPEADLVGYDVLRSVTPGGPYERVNSRHLTSRDFIDFGLTPGTTYHYVVVALDSEGRESGWSVEVSGRPGARELR